MRKGRYVKGRLLEPSCDMVIGYTEMDEKDLTLASSSNDVGRRCPRPMLSLELNEYQNARKNHVNYCTGADGVYAFFLNIVGSKFNSRKW